jgi:hypothetical protein
MIVVTELALIAAAVGGSTHALGHDFVIFGSRLDGLAVGPPFVCGIAVRMVGLLALEHAAAARLEPARRGLRVAAGADEIPTPDNGSRQLGDERTGRPRVDTAGADESGQVTPPVENATAPEASSQRRHPFWPGAPAPAAAADRPSTDLLHRVSLRIITMPRHAQGVITCDNVGADVSAAAFFASDRHREVGNCDRNVYAAR